MNPRHPIYLSDLNRALPEVQLPANARILITGATGLVGACLTDMLALINERQGLSLTLYAASRDENRAKARFRFADCVVPVRMDLTAPIKDLPEADFIVHAASNAHPMAFSLDPVGTMRANIFGTLSLLEHLRVQGFGRLLFLSTGEIYGENPAVQDGFSEDDFGKIDPMNPRSCYPESKRAAETLAASYVRQYGVDALAARLCYIYGPTITNSNSRADAQFLRKALAGEDIVLKSAGTQVRSYAYAADAAGALITLMARGEAGRAYNVANRAGVASIREYAETLARLAGGGVVFDLPPEDERRGYSAVTRAVQNPARLEALGWCASFTLEEGLHHTLQILGENHHD